MSNNLRGRITTAPLIGEGSGHYRDYRIDADSHAMFFISGEHSEIHAGMHYALHYASSDMGAIAAPADMLTLTFTTPATGNIHMLVGSTTSAGGRFRFIEGKTGGGITPGGRLVPNNNNRSSSNTTNLIDYEAAPAVGAVSKEVTLFTGGVSLVDIIIGATGQGNALAAGSERGMNEWLLDASIDYQLSLYNAAAVPGSISLSYYWRLPKL